MPTEYGFDNLAIAAHEHQADLIAESMRWRQLKLVRAQEEAKHGAWQRFCDKIVHGLSHLRPHRVANQHSVLQH